MSISGNPPYMIRKASGGLRARPAFCGLSQEGLDHFSRPKGVLLLLHVNSLNRAAVLLMVAI
jgi:hypothetical protein